MKKLFKIFSKNIEIVDGDFDIDHILVKKTVKGKTKRLTNLRYKRIKLWTSTNLQSGWRRKIIPILHEALSLTKLVQLFNSYEEESKIKSMSRRLEF